MKTIQKIRLIVVVLLGIFAIWLEYDNVIENSLFFSWSQYVPFWVLIALTVVFFVRDLFSSVKKAVRNLSFWVGIVAILAVSIHGWLRYRIEVSETEFTAWTQKIGSDGGFNLYFKSHGKLKAERNDHWCQTIYYGTYSKSGNQITIDLPLDFELGKEAEIVGDSLVFPEVSLRFFRSDD